MKNELVMILDVSGSMYRIAEDTIGGFNSLVEEQKKLDENATMTLVQFNQWVKTIYSDIPLHSVEQMTGDTFKPGGVTALYDAIGETINAVESGRCKNCGGGVKTIVAIITDGLENASKEFTQENIKSMIDDKKENDNWEFVFLAANQDAFASGASIGISKKDTFGFAATSDGMRSAMNTCGKSYSGYMAANLTPEDQNE